MNHNEQQRNDEGRDLWNNKAEFWDNLHGDTGNKFHRRLIAPNLEKLLNLQAGERVLDVACGNGVVARRLAGLGAIVTATDFSAELIELAKKRGQANGEPIDYRVVDATNETALLELGAGQFDAIVCTMALMDMPVISPLYRAAKRLLKPTGRLVIATAHPAFNSNNPVFFREQGDNHGTLYTHTGLKITGYLQVEPVKSLGARDEPNPHYYYHRPLHELLGAAFDAGLILDALIEPAYPQDASITRLSWDAVWQIPPILVARLRP